MNCLKILKSVGQNRSVISRIQNYRLYSVAAKAVQNHVYTDKEIEEIKKIFRSCPSYQKVESVGKEELPHIFNAMHLPRTQQQLNQAYAFFNNVCGGRLYMHDLVRLVQTEHDPVQHLIQYANMMDGNKDGFISAEEYKLGVETIKLWYPTAKITNLKVDYELFVQEADISKDGKVSVEELKAWLIKNAQ